MSQDVEQGCGQHQVGREGTWGEKGPVTIFRSFSPHGRRARVQSMLGREDTPRHMLPGAPDTTVHLRPQATGCHHLSSCPTGEMGTSDGHWSEGWGEPPSP